MDEVEKQEEEKWDLKKIALLALVLAISFFALKTFVLDKNTSFKSLLKKGSSEVQGTATESVPPQLNLQREVQNKLSDIKKEVNNINVADIASSSPQVQKVLNDIKNLQDLPQSQAKDACLKICSGL